jgi:hypothetical protein
MHTPTLGGVLSFRISNSREGLRKDVVGLQLSIEEDFKVHIEGPVCNLASEI